MHGLRPRNRRDSLPLAYDDDTFSATVDRWRVESFSTAMLRFVVEPQPLAGKFNVSDGMLRAGLDPTPGGDDIDVCTSGALTHSGGKIIAGADDSFCFNCTCP